MQANDEVLFAYARTKDHPTPTFLKLTGPSTAHPKTDVLLKVQNGIGAVIGAVGIYQLPAGQGEPKLLGKTESNGVLTCQFPAAGNYELKADSKDDYLTIRSNKFYLTVT